MVVLSLLTKNNDNSKNSETVGLITTPLLYGNGHVPKWAKTTLVHIILCTEMVCTKMDMYRTGPTLRTSVCSCLHFYSFKQVSIDEHRKKTCKNSVKITTESDSNIKHVQGQKH